jgi:cytidylate kinase
VPSPSTLYKALDVKWHHQVNQRIKVNVLHKREDIENAFHKTLYGLDFRSTIISLVLDSQRCRINSSDQSSWSKSITRKRSSLHQ